MTSNLSAIDFIQERSEATPGLFNRFLSTISANIAAINSNATINLSGATLSIGSSVSIGRDLWVQGTVTVGTEPSVATRTAVNIGVRSDTSDYLYLTDESATRSSYILGSHVGGTADGLNLWDQSGSTMIVSFSKQSVRFWQNVIGTSFDVGGAEFNVRAFGARGDGVTDDTAAFQAAISAATLINAGIIRIPSSQSAYLITSTLTLGPNLSFAGGGGYNPALKYNGPTASPMFSFLGTSESQGCNITFQNLSITPSTTKRSVGIRLRNFSNVYLRNVDLSQWSTGLWADWGQAIYIENCNISTNSFGLHLGGTGPAGGIRGSGLPHFCDWVRISNCQFSQNQVDIEHKGSQAAHGGLNILGSTFFESSTASVSNKTYFLHVAGLKSLTILGNTWESPWARACLSLRTADTEGTSQGTVYGGLIAGNEFLLNGGSGNTGILVRAGSQIVMTGNAFETLGNATAYDLADPVNVNYVGPSFYSGTPFTQIRESQGSTNLILDPLRVSSLGTIETLTVSGGTVASPTDGSKIRLFGGSGARIQIYPAGSSHSAFELDNFVTNSAPKLRVYTQGAVVFSASSRQLIVEQDGSVAVPPYTFSNETKLGWYRSGNSTIALSYGSLSIAAGASGVPLAQFGAADGVLNYVFVDGLRIGGEDQTNTLYNSNRSIGITCDSGGTIFIGQTNSRITGLTIRTATGASVVSSGQATLPTMTFMSDQSLGWYSSGAQTIAQSIGTLNLATNGVRLSVRTAASLDSTNLAVNEMAFTFIQSGASLGIRSGGTIWYFTSSASTKG